MHFASKIKRGPAKFTKEHAHWEFTNVKHPGFTMGKVRQLPPIWMASAAQTIIVTAVLIALKIHLIPFQ
jgi:hypothetical protein